MHTLIDVVLAHPLAAARLGFLAGVGLAGALMACLTDEALRLSVSEALKRAGWSIEAAAAQIGISRQRLGHQLDGSDPLTCLSRLARLDGFWPALIDLTAQPFGVLVVQHQTLAEILETLQGNKPMQRMTLVAHATKETA